MRHRLVEPAVRLQRGAEIVFRDGAIQSLGRSGVGKPVLRDHEQGDSLLRGTPNDGIRGGLNDGD